LYKLKKLSRFAHATNRLWSSDNYFIWITVVWITVVRITDFLL